MRKKIIEIVFSGALLIFCSICFSSSGQATIEPGAGLNTGPAEIVDCAKIGTGNKKVCMSINTNPCTESGCF